MTSGGSLLVINYKPVVLNVAQQLSISPVSKSPFGFRAAGWGECQGDEKDAGSKIIILISKYIFRSLCILLVTNILLFHLS